RPADGAARPGVFGAAPVVTDLDAGVDAANAVNHAAVLRIFAANVERLREVLYQAIPALPPLPCR
ncbi:hypothetical protein ABZ749_19775, partial [Micromonospora sp. NPDC047753]